MPRRRSIASALAALLLMIVPAVAHAAAGVCTFQSTGIAFGEFSGSAVNTSGTITITCTGGSGNNNVNIRINAGTGSTSFTTRVLTSGANHLSYQLYTDAAHTLIFGDGSGGSRQITVPINYVSGVAPPRTVTFYAVLPAQAVPPPGTYSSTITITAAGGGASGTGSFTVTARVPPLCSTTANNLNFGAYGGVQLDGTSTLSVTCTAGFPYNIGLNQGVAPGATVTTRKMTGPGGALLAYGLFQDPGRTTNWGNTVGTDAVASTGTGVAQAFTVYGRIPASQFPAAGSYQDTITVTLTF